MIACLGYNVTISGLKKVHLHEKVDVVNYLKDYLGTQYWNQIKDEWALYRGHEIANGKISANRSKEMRITKNEDIFDLLGDPDSPLCIVMEYRRTKKFALFKACAERRLTADESVIALMNGVKK